MHGKQSQPYSEAHTALRLSKCYYINVYFKIIKGPMSKHPAMSPKKYKVNITKI